MDPKDTGILNIPEIKHLEMGYFPQISGFGGPLFPLENG